MYQHPDLSPVRPHDAFLARGVKAPLPHHLEERWGVLTSGIGQQDLAAGNEQSGDQTRERREVSALVDYVGGEYEVEEPDPLPGWHMPVEQPGLQFPADIYAGIVEDEIEGGSVVVGGHDAGSAREGGHARETDAASELDYVPVPEVLLRDTIRECPGARPEIRPVRKTLIPRELLFVYEGVGGRRMRYPVARVADLDVGVDEPGETAKVRK